MNGYLALLPILIPIYLVLRNSQYEHRMRALGTAIIEEAKQVKSEYPAEYPAYRAEAFKALKTHGVSDLIVYLPKE